MTKLTLTGMRAMAPADVVAFTRMVLEKLAGDDLLVKYSPDQPRGANGRFASGGGKHGGSGGDHEGGGGEEESGGGHVGHAGGTHGHSAVGHGGGESSGGHVGGGTEKGVVFVGPKGSVGETITHPTAGEGKIVGESKNSITIQYGDGTTKQHAATFAPQKAKLVETGSETGKTHIANVKVTGKGEVTNKDNGKTVGHVKQNADGSWSFHHADSGEDQGGFTSKHQAVKALVEHNNAHAAAKPAEEPKKPAKETKPAEEAKPAKTYQDAGKVDGHQLGYEGDADVGNLKVKDGVTGAKLGDVGKLGPNSYLAMHADGTDFHVGSEADAIESIVNHQNAKYGGGETAKPAEAAKPEQKPTTAKPTEPYENTDAVKSNTLTVEPVSGVAGSKDYTVSDQKTGAQIGYINGLANGDYYAYHEDGTAIGGGKKYAGGEYPQMMKDLTDYHNSTYAKAEAQKPAETAKPKAPAPSYTKAGTDVKASDITVKKDGTAIHKGTGEVLGTVDKTGYGGWGAQHVSGVKANQTTWGEITKKEAVSKLADKHNARTALETGVEADKSTSWSQDAKKTTVADSEPLDGKPTYASQHVQIKDSNSGDVIGEIKTNPDGGYDVTHVSGASYHQNSLSSYQAKQSLISFHNQAVAKAEGKEPEAATPKRKPVEAQKPAYETAASVSSYNLKSSNVQKDAAGKITGSDVVNGSGVKIGETKANADGTMDVYHADGTKVAEHVTPGTGAATQKLAEYHNTTYGSKNAPAATSAASSSHSAYASNPGEKVVGPEEAPKIGPTAVSEAPGGLHNDPESIYKPPTAEEAASGKFSGADAYNVLQNQPAASSLDLKSSEISAIKSYTGNGFVSMNKALRGQISSDANTNNKIKNLDNVFAKAPELQHSIVSYRGIKPDGATKLFGSVGSKVGKTVADPGYTSTATHPANAFGSSGAFIRVFTPAGTHVLRPDGHGSFGDGESEILLGRGTKFKVMRDEMVNGQRQVDVVVVGNAYQ